jgi:hypothetical protein
LFVQTSVRVIFEQGCICSCCVQCAGVLSEGGIGRHTQKFAGCRTTFRDWMAGISCLAGCVRAGVSSEAREGAGSCLDTPGSIRDRYCGLLSVVGCWMAVLVGGNRHVCQLVFAQSERFEMRDLGRGCCPYFLYCTRAQGLLGPM